MMGERWRIYLRCLIILERSVTDVLWFVFTQWNILHILLPIIKKKKKDLIRHGKRKQTIGIVLKETQAEITMSFP